MGLKLRADGAPAPDYAQLASMVESSFYPTPAKSNEKPASLDAAEILKLIQENPDLSAKLMQLLKVSA